MEDHLKFSPWFTRLLMLSAVIDWKISPFIYSRKVKFYDFLIVVLRNEIRSICDLWPETIIYVIHGELKTEKLIIQYFFQPWFCFITDCKALCSREIIRLVACVRPFVSLSVCQLCWVQQRGVITVKFEAKMIITSLRCLSVSVNLGPFADNLADAVDRLLICNTYVVAFWDVSWLCWWTHDVHTGGRVTGIWDLSQTETREGHEGYTGQYITLPVPMRPFFPFPASLSSPSLLPKSLPKLCTYRKTPDKPWLWFSWRSLPDLFGLPTMPPWLAGLGPFTEWKSDYCYQF